MPKQRTALTVIPRYKPDEARQLKALLIVLRRKFPGTKECGESEVQSPPAPTRTGTPDARPATGRQRRQHGRFLQQQRGRVVSDDAEAPC
jgi:hypothetical protein